MRHSRVTERNPKIIDWSADYQNKTNLQFFTDALRKLKRDGVSNDGLMLIGLLGQRDLPGHTLRMAQSVLRWDLRPSLWSHAFLLAYRVRTRRSSDVQRAPILEVTLHPRSGEFPKPENNGVVQGRLGFYENPKVDANAALLAIQMSPEEAEAVQQHAWNFNIDRLRYNLWETLGIWQGYLWSQGTRPNPLQEGVPIFSSAYVEMAFEAINLDLTPGASERNSAPEHIWNAAVWWHRNYQEFGHPISGYYVLRDRGGSMLSTDE